MTEQFYIGIDNGVSGGISIIDKNHNLVLCKKMPIERKLYFTKKKKFFNYIAFNELIDILCQHTRSFAYIERPMINPKMFNASLSAFVAYDRVTLALERVGIGFDTIDSKLWQKCFLPPKLKGKELKEASIQVAKRLYPNADIKTDGQADSLLIAEFLKRTR